MEKGTLVAWQPEAVAPEVWSGFTVSSELDIRYDTSNRKLQELVREGSAGPIQSLIQYSYDNMDRLECTAVRMNPAVFASLATSSVNACALETEGAQGHDRITKNFYDAAGQLIQVNRPGFVGGFGV